MIFGEVHFELFQESDAQQVADLLNKNRFHTARNCHMTAENYLFTQRSRGTYFSVVAKKKGKVVGIAGAYPTSDQQVAKKHQIFIGTFLVDLQYRLSYSVIMGLYGALLEGIIKGGYKEMLSGTRPKNEEAYNLMLKCGFVLLDGTPNDFGRIWLNSFLPALSKYLVTENTEVSSDNFFSNLPVVDKKEARKKEGKTKIHDRYIECEYKLDKKTVILLFDIINYKIDGAIIPNNCKFYPDFGTQGRYIVENLENSKQFTSSIELVMEPNSGLDNIKYDITLEPGQIEVIECSKEVSELRFINNGVWYKFYPNLFEEVEVLKEPIRIDREKLSLILEPSTGFITVLDGENKLATLVWPCAILPYIEGVFTPRIKDLHVEQQDNCITITEETDKYQLTRKLQLSESKMNVTTIMKCKKEGLNVRPISQIYAKKGVQGYTLKSGEKEMDFDGSAIKHEGYEYSDYTYWDTEPERFAGFPIEMISLKYPSSIVDIAIDKKCKPVIHAPMFTSTLDFDGEKVLEEQIIEQMEVYYRKEEK